MMSTIKLNDIIPKLLKHFPFEKYIVSIGYERNKSADTGSFKGYIKKRKDKVEDIVFISFIADAHYFYSFNHKDHGNAIEFVKNRIDKNEAIQSASSMIEACKKMLIYMNETGEERSQSIDNEIDKGNLFHFLQTPFTSYYKVNKLHDYSYFETLGINSEVVNHPLFDGTIFNSTGIGLKGKTLNVTNACFIMQDLNEKECGINYSNFLFDEKNDTKQEINIYSNFSEKNKGLWFSNTLSFTKGRNKSETILVNHPAEAVAHFYINQELVNYCSFFEKINVENINAIYKHTVKHSLKLKIATPNTKEAYLGDIQLYLSFIKDDHIEYIGIDENILTIKIHKYFTNKDKLLKLLKGVERFNKNYLTKNISMLGNSVKFFIKKDIITRNQTEKDIELKIPYTYKHLEGISNAILKAYPTDYITKFEKTEFIHWRNASQNYTHTIEKKIEKIQELIFS